MIHDVKCIAVNQDACGILGNLGRKGCGAGLWDDICSVGAATVTAGSLTSIP